MIVYAPPPYGFPATEDEFIAKFFADTSKGTFVEIGAHVGLYYSNTRPLWERGWSGVMIEPDPQSFKALSELYATRERVSLLNVAVTRTDGTARFAQHADPTRTGWHSLDPKWIATWERGKARYVTVNTRSVESLLNNGELPKECDFLTIDTEGSDADIVESLPEWWKPRLIICEMDKAGVRERIDREMERRGYTFQWGSYLNSAFAKPS